MRLIPPRDEHDDHPSVGRPLHRAALRALAETAAATAALVAPRECPCGTEGVRLCTACSRLLVAPAVRVDAACDALQVLDAARLRDGPDGPAGVDHRSLLPVLALGGYEDGLQALVLAWKNGGCAHLVEPFATALAPVARQLQEDLSVPALRLVPVPSRLRARLRRGEDHTLELALALRRRGAGEVLRLRARPDTGQEGHGARDRRRRRIRVRDIDGPRQDILLIDDVVTTGATLRGMHDALTAQGHRVRGAVVVAAARVPAQPSGQAHRPGCSNSRESVPAP